MKLIKSDSPYLTKGQWKKVLLALSIITLILYTIAMICSLNGSTYFILDYQNAHMDNIEAFLKKYNLMALLNACFLTLENTLILAFTLQKKPRWYYILAIYAFPLTLAYIFNGLPSIIITVIINSLCILFCIIEQLVSNKRVSGKEFGMQMLRFVIALGISFILQMLIFGIKAGYFSAENHIMNLSATFVYAIEYDIALLVILVTISLYIHREKGDSKVWITQPHYGFSQTSTKPSQKSLLKNLTKTQRNKLRLLYLRIYLTQTFGFLLLMILPFLLGKVFEFLVMYLTFAVIRYILGFKYSLHYKKESLCITVGVIVFGIMSLAVPFFTVNVITAIVLGASLATLLHLSYKYKAFYLFNKIAKPDKFAVLYVYFDEDLTELHVKRMCKFKGLDNEQINLICDYTQGNKLSYLAHKYNYSQRMINYKLDEAIDKLTQK